MNLGSHFNLHGLSVKDCKECEICNALHEKKKKKTTENLTYSCECQENSCHMLFGMLAKDDYSAFYPRKSRKSFYLSCSLIETNKQTNKQQQQQQQK